MKNPDRKKFDDYVAQMEQKSTHYTQPKQDPTPTKYPSVPIELARYTQTIYTHKREAHKNSGIIMTIPNDSFSLQELFLRSQQGTLPDNINRPIQWAENPSHDDLDMEKLGHLDLSERQALSDANTARLNNLKQKQVAKPTEKNNAANEPQIVSTAPAEETKS